jgi:hypothetical protein
VTKADIITIIAEKLKFPWARAELLVDVVFDCMEQSMSRGEKIEFELWQLHRAPVTRLRRSQPAHRRNRSRQAQASGLLQSGQGITRAGERWTEIDGRGSRCVVGTSATFPSPYSANRSDTVRLQPAARRHENPQPET